MKKTEWFYDDDRKKWWMINVVTNATHIPKITLGEGKRMTTPVKVQHINLLKENKTLRGIILALAGVIGVMTGLLAYFI